MDVNYRKKASQLSEKRLGYLREVLMIIHSVKMNCLEHVYEEKIQRTRLYVPFKSIKEAMNG
jgi:hypothetical protein